MNQKNQKQTNIQLIRLINEIHFKKSKSKINTFNIIFEKKKLNDIKSIF